MTRTSAVALIAGLTAIAGGMAGDALNLGRKLSTERRCPKCGGKAIWHATTAYCTKSRCGWFEVVKEAPRRKWAGVFRDRFALTCNECGRAIMPGQGFYSDVISGHLVRHVECHEQAEARG